MMRELHNSGFECLLKQAMSLGLIHVIYRMLNLCLVMRKYFL